MTRMGRMMVAAAGVTALLAGVAPATAMAAGTQYVTRGQYVEQLLQAVGDEPIPNSLTHQSFSDVPPSNPYYGYVAAALQQGITTGMVAPANSKLGVFGVNQPLTRAEAAAFEIRALNQTQQAQAVTSTSFTDNAQIPTALVGDVGAAAKLGLLHGFPNGTFGPMQDLTQAQVTDLIAQLNTVDNGGFRWQPIQIGSPRQYYTTLGVNTIDVMTGLVENVPFGSPVIQHAVNQQYVSTLQGEYNQIAAQWQREDVVPGVTWKPIAAVLDWIPGTTTFSNAALLMESVSSTTGQPVIVHQGMGSPVADPVPVTPNSPYMEFDSGAITASGPQVGDIWHRYWFWTGANGVEGSTPTQVIAHWFATNVGFNQSNGGQVIMTAVWR